MDIAEFLTARLDEDEQVARGATPGPWLYNPGKVWLEPDAFERFDLSQGEEYVAFGGPSPFTGCVAATGEADHPQSMADAAHIARHDPARVLRDVAAKRRILAEHEHASVDDDEELYDFGCNTCHYNAGDSVLRGFGWCKTIRLLAAPYSDHADYDPAWALEHSA